MKHFSWLSVAVAAVSSLGVACGSSNSGSEETGTGTQAVHGQVALSSYVVDNPVILAKTASGAAVVAPIRRDGSFHILLAANQPYRMILASTLRDGTYRAVSELKWGRERAAWGKLHGGADLDLGFVHPLQAGNVKTMSSGPGSDGNGKDDSNGSGSDGGSAADNEAEDDSCYRAGRADLPYDVRPGVGDTFRLTDAFLAKGAPPKEILGVTMEGGSWRLTELQQDTPFTITQADCDHEGNRDVGRDRIFVTWRNADGSTDTDHLDMRYCKGGGGGGGGASSSATHSGVCSDEDSSVCGDDVGESACDGGSMQPETAPAEPLPGCTGDAGGTTTPSSSPPAGGDATTADVGNTNPPTDAGGGACVTSADCAAGRSCFASQCLPAVR